MNDLLPIGVMIALLYLLRQLTLSVCPSGVRLVEGTLRRLWRAVVRAVWTRPVRHVGAVHTVWLWSVAVALLATIGVVVQPEPAGLGGLAFLWLVASGGWWMLRRWAQWRFRPRRLPARRRRE